MFNKKPIAPIEDVCTAAWLAGLLEGEGTFVLCKGRISIAVAMTDEDIVQRVATLWDASCHKLTSRMAHHKTAYACRVTGDRAAYYMRLVLPLMGMRRSAKIAECLSHFDKSIETRLHQISSLGRVVSDEALLLAWSKKGPKQSFREFASQLGVSNRGKLKKRIARLTGESSKAQEASIPRVNLSISIFEQDSQVRKAWLAGLLEGEGHFQIVKTAVAIQLRMTDKDIVERFCKEASSNLLFEARQQEHWKDIYLSKTYGERAVNIMRGILPYMGQRRAARIQECLARYEEGKILKAKEIQLREERLSAEVLRNLWHNRQNGESLQSVAKQLGIHRETLKRRLVNLGIYESPVYKQAIQAKSTCAACGKEFEHVAHKPRTFCSRKCVGKAASARLHANKSPAPQVGLVPA